MDFGVLFRCFTQSFSFLLHGSPLSKLSKLAHYFLFHLDGNFWEAFRSGSGSLKCPKAFLVRQQVAFPISNGAVGLISTKVIAPTTYLRKWALMAPIITSRFSLDSHIFC